MDPRGSQLVDRPRKERKNEQKKKQATTRNKDEESNSACTQDIDDQTRHISIKTNAIRSNRADSRCIKLYCPVLSCPALRRRNSIKPYLAHMFFRQRPQQEFIL